MDYIEVEGQKIALITSKDNELVKRFSKLSSAKYRELEGLFLAEGEKELTRALAAGYEPEYDGGVFRPAGAGGANGDTAPIYAGLIQNPGRNNRGIPEHII